MPCPCQDKCRLPHALKSAFLLVYWQRRYCETEAFPECARLLAADQGRPVPDGMLPSGHVLALAG